MECTVINLVAWEDNLTISPTSILPDAVILFKFVVSSLANSADEGTGNPAISMNLKTKTAGLKFLTEADFPDVLGLFQEPGTFDYIEHLKNKTDEAYVDILMDRLEQNRMKTGFHWVARTLVDKKFIGVLNLSQIRGTDKMQLGFQLSKDYWNKGLGFELAKAIIEAGTAQLGLKTIYGVFHKENIASKKILQRLQFQPAENFLHEDNIEILQFNSQPRTDINT